MPEYSTLAVFAAAALALLVIPGPAVMYIVARSIDQGRLAGLVSACGVGVGTVFHVAAAALGVSAILVSSALAFNVVKYLGAAYLIYLGLQKLLTTEQAEHMTIAEPKKLGHIFGQGVLVNLLNPKTALFFFAFLPQFVDTTRGPVAFQILILGGVMVVLGICSDGAYALLAGSLRHWLRDSERFLRAERYFVGSVYVALGVTAALGSMEES